MKSASEFRTYERSDAICFRMTSGAFGGLSNMAPGFPLRVNGLQIYTSEALYQACRFPHMPEIQKMIIEQRSPMTAKMRSKPYRRDSRTDWDRVRVKVMRWCLRVKLVQHSSKFKDLLLSTDSRAIVEESHKDDFWGAKPIEDGTLIGTNVLGRLLMELREEVKNGQEIVCVEPLTIPDFLLLREPIGEVYVDADLETTVELLGSKADVGKRSQGQLPLIPDAPRPPASTSVGGYPKPTLQPYPHYKESSVSWLGTVPSHWEIKPGFAGFREKQVKNVGMIEKRVLSLSYGRIVIKSKDKLHGLVPKSFETYQIVNPGDIIIRPTDLQNDWNSLRIGLVRDRGIITSAYICLNVVGPLLPEYGYQQLNAFDLMKVFYGMGSGLRQNLDFSDFKRMPILIPSDEEQSAIVRFLQHANGRVERAILVKKKLIALLNEQKQAIIQRAVTRGLNPDVPLKRSGVPSIGEIPHHWEVLRLRRLVHRIEQGVSPLAVGFLAEGNSWGVLKSGCVNRGVFRETEHKQLAKSFEIDPAIVVRVGDVLISRACGSPSLVGSVGKVETLKYRLILSDKTFRAVFRESVDLDFMVFAMNSRYYRDQVEQAISGAEGMANNLPVSSLRDFVFGIPPRKEAGKIVTYLRENLMGIQNATTRAEREIALLREYQTRLTADVVTGKLDVREAVRDLPAPPEEILPAVEDEELEEEEAA